MHIVLISQCEKKAILRTAKVLDAYAVRHGDRTWITPITKNGLDALYHELRSRGTRQTAVACYANEGTRRLKLLWVVGRKDAFGAAGAVAVATQSQGAKGAMLELPPAIRLACLVAECAGLIHDFGKYGQIFQAKLASATPLADPIRHEWISLQVLLAMLDGKTWEQGWNRDKPLHIDDYHAHPHGLKDGLKTIEAVLAFLVVSHHRLPTAKTAAGGQKDTATPNLPGHGEYIRADALTPSNTAAQQNPFLSQPSPLALKRIAHLLDRIRHFPLAQATPTALRAIATLARMGLILADHDVSSQDKSQSPQHGPAIANQPGAVFANTCKHKGTRTKNQELGWHLAQVGNEAGAMVRRMVGFQPPGLPPDAIERIRQPAADRFQWQNTCAAALEAAQRQAALPTLVINIAGTGCGKTRMNLRTIAALRPPGADGNQEPLRISTALNLRTLTLQTRDAYAEQLELTPQQLACVIGSQIAAQLHEQGKQESAPELLSATQLNQQPQQQGATGSAEPLLDDDENEPEEEYDMAGEGAAPPAWLEGFLKKKPLLRPLLMSPVLVSTVDYLIHAGEPHKQGHHALAMMRVMHSDLILDEFDGYDPKAMLAVARLVTAAAMWGRHVVASSATLAAPVAKLLYDAYAAGAALRAALTGQPAGWRQAVIDDRASPTVTACADTEQFTQAFAAHIASMMDAMGHCRWRPAELQPVRRNNEPKDPKQPKDDRKRFRDSVVEACSRLHARHAWQVPDNAAGFKGMLSIGLVRIANIHNAVRVARRLAEKLPHVRVCCYHAQVGALQRWHIEHTLDAVLNRKHPDWAQRTVAHEAVLGALRKAHQDGVDSLPVIVVATPVEEIGRDHDFDWAVIEPSSSQSIVQTAGRVNRHRLAVVQTPNIAVMQYNFLACTQATFGPVFLRPGLQSSVKGECGQLYGGHDLEHLLDWDLLERQGQIDARLRYQTSHHQFAQADDASLGEAVEHPLRGFLNPENHAWLLKNTYTTAPLRDDGGAKYEDWCTGHDGKDCRREPDGRVGIDFAWRERKPDDTQRHPNDWLALSFEQTTRMAEKMGLALAAATTVQVRAYGEDDPKKVCRDRSFGYYWTK